MVPLLYAELIGIVMGGGTLLYARQDIPSKLLQNLEISENLEGVFAEPNFRQKNG